MRAESTNSFSLDAAATDDLTAMLKRNPLQGLSVDDTECFPFVDTMYQLLRAVVVYSLNRDLDNMKRGTATKSNKAADLRLSSKERMTKYQEKFARRAAAEKELIECMKRARCLELTVKQFREKVRVARLLNQVSVNGHTLISWAAANGAYEVVEETLSHGATVGYPAHLLHLTATFLQVSYRIYKRYCFAKYKQAAFRVQASLSTVAKNEDTNLGLSQGKLDSLETIRGISELVYFHFLNYYDIYSLLIYYIIQNLN